MDEPFDQAFFDKQLQEKIEQDGEADYHWSVEAFDKTGNGWTL